MNEYSLKARIYPIIFLITPLIIIGITYSIEYKNYFTTFSTLSLGGLFAYFFSNIGRDAGKNKEKKLYKLWGGIPTAQLLDFNNNELDILTKEKYHKKLLKLAPLEGNIDFRTIDNSQKHEIYLYWSKYLVSQTRDSKKYSLLYYENTSYGFRRNLWSLKPFGILIIIFCLILNTIIQEVKFKGITNFNFSFDYFFSQSVLIVLLLFWIFVIKPTWVKIPAFSYANRLLETINNFEINETNNI